MKIHTLLAYNDKSRNTVKIALNNKNVNVLCPFFFDILIL